MPGQAAGDDPVEVRQVGIAVHREAVQRHASAEQPDADRAHLVVAVPHAGLDVLPPVELDPEIGADADHRLLHPAEMRGGVGRGTQVEDRVPDQLARTVERELPSAIDPMDLGAARGQLVRRPQELVGPRAAPRREDRRMLQEDHGVGDLAGQPRSASRCIASFAIP